MASTSLSSVNGIASGVQWQDLVTQIMAAESARSVDPLTAKKTSASNAQTAWKSFQGVAAAFRDAASAIKDPALFGSTTIGVPNGSGILTASGSATAVPGRYDVEVLQLARTDKMGGGIVADPAAALGVSGSLVVNGRAITVAATDSLQGIRDKFNAANAGANASGVSAVIQGSASGGARLVLTAADTGANGIEVADATAGTLAALGLTDGTTSANTLATGEQQSFRASSSTTAIASLLGVPTPTPATMNVGGQVIHVDLATDTLASIATKINNAIGRSDAARIVTETANGRAQSRLVTTVPVTADGTVDQAASASTLALLGLTRTGRGGVAQVVGSSSAYTGLAGAATGATKLTDLGTAAGSSGLAVGDVLSLRGTRGDGTNVTRSITIGAGTTMQDVLDQLNDNAQGFAAGARPAVATLDGSGRLFLTDSQAGDSQLALGITVTKAGGGTSTLGAFTTAAGTVGRAVGISTGQDAQLRVDGQVSTSRSNTVTSAIAGVTLNVTGTTGATPLTLTVNRDAAAITSKLNAMVTAYNNLRTWAKTNTADGAALANDPTVRSMVGSLTNTILNSVPGLESGALGNASLLGLQHDKAGVLSLDSTVLGTMLASQPTGVQRLFAMTGDTTDPELSYVTGGSATKPSTTPYAVTITRAATQAGATGAAWTTYATSGAPDKREPRQRRRPRDRRVAPQRRLRRQWPRPHGLGHGGQQAAAPGARLRLGRGLHHRVHAGRRRRRHRRPGPRRGDDARPRRGRHHQRQGGHRQRAVAHRRQGGRQRGAGRALHRHHRARRRHRALLAGARRGARRARHPHGRRGGVHQRRAHQHAAVAHGQPGPAGAGPAVAPRRAQEGAHRAVRGDGVGDREEQRARHRAHLADERALRPEQVADTLHRP
jgi:flagellar hook-associated protein 2